MAWFSMLPWTTDTVGDGAARYNEERANEFFRIFDVRDEEAEGVVPGRWNEFAVSGTASPLTVASGAAICYGRVWNDEASTLTVATPAIGTTGGRVVLQADWTAKTIRAVAKRSADGNAAIPAVQQDEGDIWEISLATFLITTGGVITVTDDRTFRQVTAELVDESVTYEKLATGAVVSNRQGGDATEWGGSFGGNNNYSTAGAKIQIGNKLTPSGLSGSGSVTYPAAFSARAIVLLQPGVDGQTIGITNMSASGFDFAFTNPLNLALPFYWMAIGPA